MKAQKWDDFVFLYECQLEIDKIKADPSLNIDIDQIKDDNGVKGNFDYETVKAWSASGKKANSASENNYWLK